MSTKPQPRFCQKLVAFIDTALPKWYAQCRSTSSNQSQPLRLHLTNQQQSLFCAHWNTNEVRKFVIVDASIKKSYHLFQAIASWNTVLSVNHQWHFISGELSNQEQLGHVTTALTQTMHVLLSGDSATNHFVIPASLLTQDLPDLKKYRAQSITLTVGEQHPIKRLTARLIRQGYTRYPRNPEPGGFSVHGENIVLAHPAQRRHYTVTLLHNTIESITIHRTPSTTTRFLTLPTLHFPDQTMPWSNLLKTGAVIRPAYLQNTNGRHTVIYDALHSLRPFPKIDISELPQDLQDRLTPQQVRRSEPSPNGYQQGLALIQTLTVNKPAVHSDHGIGIYEGLSRLAGSREYLVLRYAAGDTLAVPVEYAHKVTAYVGETTPTIHRLDGALWAKTKKAARADAVQFARELLAIAGHRQNTTGHAYLIDEQNEAALESSFPFTLTSDQARAWQEVQNDLASRTTMDRLVVGDVGFGKTEIAIRAAYHVAAAGKQVAILAPTTLLVQQHADTFRQRLTNLSEQIDVLSRFVTVQQKKEVHQKIASGDLKIIIGTHALLNKDIDWPNLGLVIIDEEQRFGVRHKEHFKQIRAHVDLLSLSATPIPRTLSMALTGLKQLSVISSPPTGRKDIKTYVGQDEDDIIKQAISQELKRGGQVYLVAPHIRNLSTILHRVQKLMPGATAAIAHGQMSTRQLADVTTRFDRGELDVLVSSSIIENGLDLPNANTIIVTRATQFGLADLYQLRGRIGRRRRQGYAYFLYNQNELTSLQKQRLAALTETTRLGSGWALAQRDLEIRGAGSLLGAKQSGSVNAVGVQLYLDMVREASDQVSQTQVSRHDVDIQLPLPTLIPLSYIADHTRRAAAYQQLSRAKTPRMLDAECAALIKHYGPLPEETRNLYRILKLQHAAAAAGITVISSSTIKPPRQKPYQRLTVTAKQPPDVLNKLSQLGNWQSRGNTLTLDLAVITPQLTQKITELLATSPEALPRWR